jgi:hypothetical protein
VQSIADSAALITIGTSWWATVISVGMVGLWATIVCVKGDLSRGVAKGIVIASIPVILVYNHGDRIQLTPHGVREIRWWREVDFIEWRHIESARTEVHQIRAKKNTWYNHVHLVLVLKTGDPWAYDINGLHPREVERVRTFCLERAGRR